MLIGEAAAGEGAELAHVNTVLGRRDGPVGTAFATALATPRAGHVPFLVAVRPGVAAAPPTLFVNKATLADDHHSELTWGAAQAGVAAGVTTAVAEGVVADVGEVVLLCAVWVNPAARDADAVYRNNRTATLAALRAGREGRPTPAEVAEAALRPANAYYVPPTA